MGGHGCLVMLRVLSGNSRWFTTKSVLQLWPPALINSIQDVAHITLLVTAQNSQVWYWNRNSLVWYYFHQMSGSWLLPVFLKVERPWEIAERKRDTDCFCGFPGLGRSHSLLPRWNNLLQEVAERLRASRALLQLWQRYKDCYQQCSSTVHQREEQTNELLKTATSKDIADDEVTSWIQDCNVCSSLQLFSALWAKKNLWKLSIAVVGVLESCILHISFYWCSLGIGYSCMYATQMSMSVSKFWFLH